MKLLNNQRGDVMMGILGFFFSLVILYGIYWIFKTVSYTVFYETMVEKTIEETVKRECLR